VCLWEIKKIQSLPARAEFFCMQWCERTEWEISFWARPLSSASKKGATEAQCILIIHPWSVESNSARFPHFFFQGRLMQHFPLCWYASIDGKSRDALSFLCPLASVKEKNLIKVQLTVLSRHSSS